MKKLFILKVGTTFKNTLNKNEVLKIKEIPKEELLNSVEQTNEANLILKKFGQIVEKEINYE